MEYARKLLEQIGLEGRRVQMINVSSAMGGQFAWSAAELTEEIRRMGPNPLGNSNGKLKGEHQVFEPQFESEESE